MHSIGKVISVTPDKLIFEVSDFNKLNYNLTGSTYIVKGLIDYVTIPYDSHTKFIYQIFKIEDKEQKLDNNENSKLDYIGLFECLPIGMIKKDKIELSMEFYPFLQNKVYLSSEEEKAIIFSKNNSYNSINLGLIENKYGDQILLENIFHHHSAILGNTGSGKSSTIRKIISETLKITTNNLHLHIFDVHEEYAIRHNRIQIIDNYKIDLNNLELEDWINLLKPSEQSQLPMLMQALKLAHAIENDQIEYTWLDCYISYTLYTHSQTDAGSVITRIKHYLQNILDAEQLDLLDLNFGKKISDKKKEEKFLISIQQKMSDLEGKKSEISKENVKNAFYDSSSFLSSKLEQSLYKVSSFNALLIGLEYAFRLEECKGNNQIKGFCSGLVTRIETQKYKTQELWNHQKNDSNIKDETTLNYQNQTFVYNVSNYDDDNLLFLTTYILKKIFNENKKKSFNERKVHVFILEEAHRYISNAKEKNYFHENEFFKKIAREGRKFGCFLFLSSQRPSELSATILSQCNNYLLHRIKNNIDLEYISKTIPYIDKTQLKRISYLPTGTTLVVGELAPISLEIAVKQDRKTENISKTPLISCYEDLIF